MVQGDAGSGKTTMLREVRELAAAGRWDIVGIAVQGVAARKLEEETGIRSTTLAYYLAEESVPRRLPRLVIVDEASMLDSRSFAKLRKLAEAAHDKLVLVGDRNQLQSVGAGKPFERRVEAAEKDGTLLSLNENYRQRDPELRRVVDLARAGKLREALDRLDDKGKLDEIEDTHLRRLEVAKEYTPNTLIVTGTRASRDALNELIRRRLVKEGGLGKSKDYSLKWSDDDGVRHVVRRELAVGDRVTFLENEYKRYDVRNGEVGTITRDGEKTLGVRLGDGREVSIDLRHYATLDYGYALTTYKSQGQTYDKVVVEADTRFAHLQDQRNSYVQLTRAREDVRIYTDDREALKEAAGMLGHKRDTLHIDVPVSPEPAIEHQHQPELRHDRPRLDLGMGL